jgi:hypothetical protein
MVMRGDEEAAMAGRQGLVEVPLPLAPIYVNLTQLSLITVEKKTVFIL